MSTKEIEAYIVNVETEASLAAPLENQKALIKVTAQSGESTGEVDFIDGFFRGRLELLRLAADEFSLLAGFCDIALHELTSEGGISLGLLRQMLKVGDIALFVGARGGEKPAVQLELGEQHVLLLSLKQAKSFALLCRNAAAIIRNGEK